jgi:hypothetical protein
VFPSSWLVQWRCRLRARNHGQKQEYAQTTLRCSMRTRTVYAYPAGWSTVRQDHQCDDAVKKNQNVIAVSGR